MKDYQNLIFCFTLVPIRAMTRLGANGKIRPKNSFQKVSIFGTFYLSQKWWRPCIEAKHMYLQFLRNMWLCTDTGSPPLKKKLRTKQDFTRQPVLWAILDPFLCEWNWLVWLILVKPKIKKRLNGQKNLIIIRSFVLKHMNLYLFVQIHGINS